MASVHPDPTHHIRATHELAMATKEATFRAQDALSRAWSDHAEREELGDRGRERERLLRKLEKRLGRVRAELEQIDNETRRVLARIRVPVYGG